MTEGQVAAGQIGAIPVEAGEPELKSSSAGWPSQGQVRYSMFILVVTLTLAQLDMAIVPYLVPSIKVDLQLSDWQMGLLLGVSFGLFYSLVGLPSSWFVDRFPRKRILAIGLATWSLGTALCGFAQNFFQLFIARFLVGGGEALNGPASYSLIGDLVPREGLARAVATYLFGAVLGQGLALLLGAYALHLLLNVPPIHLSFATIHGWQLVLLALGLPGLLFCALISKTLKEPRRQLSPERIQSLAAERGKSLFASVVGDFGEAFGYVIKRWQVFAPMFGSSALGGLALGAGQWIPIFYLRTFGWAPAKVALLSGLSSLVFMPLGLFVSVKFTEFLTRRYKDDAAMRVSLIAGCLALPFGLAFPLLPSPWLAFAFGCLGVFASALGQAANNAVNLWVLPGEMRGKMTALFLFTFFVTAVMIGPLVTAGLTDFVFRDESMIRWALFTSAVMFSPAALFIRYLGLGPYRREIIRLRSLEVGQKAA